MYDDLVKRLRNKGCQICPICREAADAIEALTQAKEELAEQVAYWQAQLTQAMCGETLADLEKSRWVPVMEPPKEET